uniref:Uncharacterized protein n=1 Tax=Noctiluca scintillans TaxID=2966 RepID=A0A7S1FAT4_NOCSC
MDEDLFCVNVKEVVPKFDQFSQKEPWDFQRPFGDNVAHRSPASPSTFASSSPSRSCCASEREVRNLSLSFENSVADRYQVLSPAHVDACGPVAGALPDLAETEDLQQRVCQVQDSWSPKDSPARGTSESTWADDFTLPRVSGFDDPPAREARERMWAEASVEERTDMRLDVASPAMDGPLTESPTADLECNFVQVSDFECREDPLAAQLVVPVNVTESCGPSAQEGTPDGLLRTPSSHIRVGKGLPATRSQPCSPVSSSRRVGDERLLLARAAARSAAAIRQAELRREVGKHDAYIESLMSSCLSKEEMREPYHVRRTPTVRVAPVSCSPLHVGDRLASMSTLPDGAEQAIRMTLGHQSCVR